MHRSVRLLAASCGMVLLAACAGDAPDAVQPERPSLAAGSAEAAQAYLQEVNAALEARGADFRVAKAELALAPTAPPDMASIVFTNDRELRLESKWVPGDPRRAGRTTLLQYFYSPFAGVNTNMGLGNGEPAVDASFGTWEDQACFPIDIQKRPFDGAFPSAIFAGGNPLVADINTLGFLPGAFFDLVLGPGASSNVLGVTFTFWWVNGGVPTDIDGNGRLDTAFKEVWYNNAFTWTLTGDPNFIDVESVALHENGHTLEMGHFGKIHATFSQNGGRLHVSPRAVMNAVILGTLREPLGTDNASLCSNFSSWPNS